MVKTGKVLKILTCSFRHVEHLLERASQLHSFWVSSVCDHRSSPRRLEFSASIERRSAGVRHRRECPVKAENSQQNLDDTSLSRVSALKQISTADITAKTSNSLINLNVCVHLLQMSLKSSYTLLATSMQYRIAIQSQVVIRSNQIKEQLSECHV